MGKRKISLRAARLVGLLLSAVAFYACWRPELAEPSPGKRDVLFKRGDPLADAESKSKSWYDCSKLRLGELVDATTNRQSIVRMCAMEELGLRFRDGDEAFKNMSRPPPPIPYPRTVPVPTWALSRMEVLLL
jgi:hypothetical protein